MSIESINFKLIFLKEIEIALVPKLIGFLKSSEIDELLDKLSLLIDKFPFDIQNKNNFLRFLDVFGDNIYFIKDLTKNSFLLDVVLNITCHSNYLTDLILINKEFLNYLDRPSRLNNAIDIQKIKNDINSDIRHFSTFESKVNYLKKTRKLFTLLVATQDLFNISDLPKTTYNLSQIAIIILTELFETCLKEVKQNKLGKDLKINYTIISLGKLGGNELNYSSDVDLIAFFDKNKILDKSKDIYTYDILNEAIQLFIKTGTDINDKGFIYRIDFRLRPDGKNAPLCRSIQDMIHYYEYRGSDWERLMLLKMNFLCGNKNLFNSFSSQIKSFIFPAYFSVSPLDIVAKLKNEIEKSLDNDSNIKLSSGGIRDIEFLTQALILLNKNIFKNNVTNNSLEAINLLHQNNIITNKQFTTLVSNYIFFRKIEHYVQLIDYNQTHSIPSSTNELTRLSFFFNYTSKDFLIVDINTKKTQIKNIFNSYINYGNIHNEVNIKFYNKEVSDKIFIFLRKGISLSGIKYFDQRTLDLFASLEPIILNYLKKASNPDKTLNNFSKLISVYSFPSILYNELQNKNILKSFLTICEFSQKSVDLLINKPKLFDLFLSGFTFVKIRKINFTSYDIDTIVLCLSIQYSLKLISSKQLMKCLSEYIIFTIESIAYKNNLSEDILITTSGSLSNFTFTFNSDIDLIILTKTTLTENEIVLLKRTIDKIKLALPYFKIDFRLRPEGMKGFLYNDLSSFKTYFEKRVSFWEYMAYFRLKRIYGNKNLFKDFLNIISSSFQANSSIDLRKEYINNYANITQNNFSFSKIDLKKDKGLMSEYIFIVFYKLIFNRNLYKINISLSEQSKLSNLLDSSIRKTFLDNLFFLKSISLANQVILNCNDSTIRTDIPNSNEFIKFLSIKDWHGFIARIEATKKTMFEIKKDLQKIEGHSES